MRRVLLALLCAFGAAAASAGGSELVGLLELLNYYEYSPQLMSSGQPTREQFPAIRAAGVEAVINLAPVTDPGALADEQQVVAALGMAYVHIPVDWDHPPVADVERFLAAMTHFQGKRVLVHCRVRAPRPLCLCIVFAPWASRSTPRASRWNRSGPIIPATNCR